MPDLTNISAITLYLMVMPCQCQFKTSMMWPSQNFLLYIRNVIKMKVTEWINNLKKYVIPPPPFGDIYNMYKL